MNITLIKPNENLLESGYLQKVLHEKGALLLRDFQINTAEKFKDIASLLMNDLMSDNGEHNPLSDTQGVYTPVNYSSKEKLLWHNENSFNHTWPLIILFGAQRPADIGGETPIVDSRLVLENLDKEVVDEFKNKGVMYQRTHGFGFGRSWQETYQTQNKVELEKLCLERRIKTQWLEDDQLITKQIRPAIVAHPLTGELSWFNQAQHWHPYCLNSDVRTSLEQIFSKEMMPRNCFFGDGSVISDDIMQHIVDIYQEFEISFPWKKGDVMILDNVLFAHARNPYSGERKLFVTMGKKTCFLNDVSYESKVL